MIELLVESVSLVNLPYTVILGLAVIYWVLYIAGAVGSDVLHFFGVEVDADVHADVGDVGGHFEVGDAGGHFEVGDAGGHFEVGDAGGHFEIGDAGGHFEVGDAGGHFEVGDAGGHLETGGDVDAGDVHGGHDLGHGGSWLGSMLHFFHVGEVPVLFIFSILILAMWTLSMLANHYLDNQNGYVALALFPLNVLASLAVTKAVVMPFAPLLSRVFEVKGDKIDLIGKRCTVSSLEVTPHHGQAEFATKGAPLLLNVKCKEGARLVRGDEAVICDYDPDRNVYWITKFDLPAFPLER